MNIDKEKTTWIPTGKIVKIINPLTKKLQKVERGELVNLKRRFETKICKELSITKGQLKRKLKKSFEFTEEYTKLLNDFYDDLKV